MQQIKKLSMFLFLILSIIFTDFIFPLEKVPVDTCGTGILTILNADSTMNLFLDEQLLENNSDHKKHLPPGKHVIQLTPPDRSVWRVGDWKKEFEITSGESLAITIPEIKYLYINSIPFDATVFLNDSLTGKTPLFITWTNPKNDILRIQMDGYKDYLIPSHDLKTDYLNIRLETDKAVNEIHLQKVLHFKNKRTQKKLLTYSMLGLTLISGVTTIYLRQEADQRYDRYLAAGLPADMNKLFEETKDYDRYAAIAYGTFQLSFISALYLLFKK